MRQRTWLLLAGFFAASITAAGCNYLLLADRSLSASIGTSDFEAATGASLVDPAMRIVVVSNAPRSVREKHPDFDRDLADLVTFRLRQNHLHVVAADEVHTWLAAHTDWVEQKQIGNAFGADYVINIDLHSLKDDVKPIASPVPGIVFEPDPHSRAQYAASQESERLRTEATVTVGVLNGATGEPIYCQNVTLTDEAPGTLDDERFRKNLVAALSRSIADLFSPSLSGNALESRYSVRRTSCRMSN